MKCPIDQNILQMTERSGVEIDYCPECRGIWLDRGELDKIIEKAEQQNVQQAAQYAERSDTDDRHQDDRDDRHDEHKQDDRSSPNNKKKGSFIGDIFGGFGED